MIKAQMTEDSISSSSEDAFELYERSRYGEKTGKVIEYAPIEAIFLVQEGKMEVYQKATKIFIEKLIAKVKKTDKKIVTKSIVYTDLRKKGYITKTALKFGSEFRVYEKGVKPGEDHARWLLYTAEENGSLNWHDFTAKNRVAHSAKKKLLLAIVDTEKDVLYHEVSWLGM